MGWMFIETSRKFVSDNTHIYNATVKIMPIHDTEFGAGSLAVVDPYYFLMGWI